MWRSNQLTRCGSIVQSGSNQITWSWLSMVPTDRGYERQMLPVSFLRGSTHHLQRATPLQRVATRVGAPFQPSSVWLATQRSFTSIAATRQLSVQLRHKLGFGAKKPALFPTEQRQLKGKSFSLTSLCRTTHHSASLPLTTHSDLSQFLRLITRFRMEQFIMKPKNFSTSTEHKEIAFKAPKIGDCSTVEVDRHYLKSTTKQKVNRIIVEGNIGSGKTTFLEIFYKNSVSLLKKPLVMPEPIDLWRDVGGVNIFQLLADDPKRWSFTFQSYVQLTMIKIHELMPKDGDLKVMERSLYSARYCFVENLHRKQLLEPCEYYVLDQWFQSCLPSAEVDLIIYLRTDPDVVFERIQRRARPEESKITLEYLRTLHELHEDWLVHEKFPLPAPVMTINANIPLEKIMSVYEEKTGGILRQYHA